MEQIKIRYHSDIEPVSKIVVGDWIDLRAADDYFINVGDFELISLGVSMKLPEGYEALVVPRSSTFNNYGIIMTNSVGIIDNAYCGDNDIWRFPAWCLTGKTVVNGRAGTKIEKGDRICQFKIEKKQPEIEFIQVEHLDDTDRGGFGSTGRK